MWLLSLAQVCVSTITSSNIVTTVLLSFLFPSYLCILSFLHFSSFNLLSLNLISQVSALLRSLQQQQQQQLIISPPHPSFLPLPPPACPSDHPQLPPCLHLVLLVSPQNVQRFRRLFSGCSCSTTSRLSSPSLQLLLVQSAPLCGSHLQRERERWDDEALLTTEWQIWRESKV